MVCAKTFNQAVAAELREPVTVAAVHPNHSLADSAQMIAALAHAGSLSVPLASSSIRG
jgi:hypothetical protein